MALCLWRRGGHRFFIDTSPIWTILNPNGDRSRYTNSHRDYIGLIYALMDTMSDHSSAYPFQVPIIRVTDTDAVSSEQLPILQQRTLFLGSNPWLSDEALSDPESNNPRHSSETSPMTPQTGSRTHPESAFLGLPREIRDIIYERYVSDIDGFVYDPKTHNFMTTNGEPVNIPLAYTCRTMYDELWKRVCEVKSIIFYTAFSEETREEAGLWHGGLHKLDLYKDHLADLMARQFLTGTLEDEIAAHYPQFKPILARWRSKIEVTAESKGHDWGETPSIYRDFICHTLEAIAKDPKFVLTGQRWVNGLWIPQDKYAVFRNMFELIGLRPEPWNIPSEEEVSRLSNLSGVTTKASSVVANERRFYHEDANYRYSAASVAIRFLENPPMMVHKHIRNIRSIKLIEDRESIAHPECHIRGLVRHCRDMPSLRVERRVDLWMTAYPFGDSGYFEPPFAHASTLSRRRFVNPECKTKAIARWMTEANALNCLGMPPGAFTPLFDGDPYPDLSHHVFRTVFQRDVAWQIAMDMSYANEDGLPEPSWLNRRRRDGYMYEDTPALVRDMNFGIGIIHCNFDIGHESDPKYIVLQCQGMDIKGWKKKWYEHQIFWSGADMRPFHPLPDWRALRGEYLIPT